MNPARLNPEDLPLAPVHLPPPPPWWPPAPGWWLLAGLALILLILSVRALARAWRHRRWRRRILARLRALRAEPDPLRRLSELNVLLRQVALARHGRRSVAGLEGRDWLEFLDRTGGPGFSAGPGQILGEGPYRRQADYDWQALERLARTWLERQLAELR